MREELPSGTVTFLFTDVEGSTRLLTELGPEAYAEALEKHRAVIRSALGEHGGREVDTQGDAFFCAFSSARAAVACAASVQSSLEDGPIQVRMGIHTGEALVAGSHYVGMDVHRAARIGACGHGGQVVISPATVALLEEGSFPVRDLGEHRLKDLSAPVRLYQLGEREFGPLKTLFRTNLPVPATPFLGREHELEDIVARTSEPAVRLLTLTGPGGTGKTRLALQTAAELADRFPDGVFWAPLATLKDPALVPSAVAEAIGVEEKPGEPLAAAIPRALDGKRLLLLVDNCEHLLDAAAQLVSPLLSACPDVLVLATSREPLTVAGEHVYAVQPLLTTDATSLFEGRARAAGAVIDATESKATIEQLCARLDNLPLAVELAAARTAAIPPATLLDRLSVSLDVLKGPRDADERQRTLRATIAWSHDLLDADEQRLFRRLSVFPAGAGLEAVETVCDADLEELLSLVAKSLVRHTQTDGAEPRYWMLETIREFAVAMLDEAKEATTYRDRHLDRFVEFGREASGRLVGPGSAEWMRRLENDRENLRAALSWALARADETGEDAAGRYGSAAVTLGAVAGELHMLRGRFAEAEEVLRSALALEPGWRDATRLQSWLGRLLRQRERPGEGLAAHLEAERLLDDVPERDAEWWHAWISVKLEQAHHHYFVGDVAALRDVIEEVRPQIDERGTPLQGLDFLHVLAQEAYRRERYVLSAESETLIRDVYRRSLEYDDGTAEFTLGFGLLWRGKLDEAAGALERGLDAARRHGDALIEVRCLVYGLLTERRRGNVASARDRLAQLRSLDDVLGYRGLVQANTSWLEYREGDFESAAAAAETAIADWESAERFGPTMFQWTARFPMVGVELERGRVEAAFEHARAMLHPSQQPLPAEVQDALARAVEREDSGLLRRALEVARATGHA